MIPVSSKSVLGVGAPAGSPQGQVVFGGVTNAAGLSAAQRDWVVPNGVTSISVVAVGSGSSGGGALCYRNDIPVTPGETLRVFVGATWSIDPEKVAANGANYVEADDSWIERDGVKLVLAKGGKRQGSTVSGAGGQAADCIGDVANSGGNSGRRSSTVRPYGSGAGAGGYMVPGGNGGNGSGDGDLNDGHRCGPGGGGIGLLGLFEGEDGLTPATGGTSHTGGVTGGGSPGIGAYRGANGPNYNNTDNNDPPGALYGGGTALPEFDDRGSGAIRIIWGEGRSFPYNADDVPEVSI